MKTPERRAEGMPALSYLSLGSTERKNVGAIVTVRELESAVRMVMHEKGTTAEALTAVCDRLDRLHGDWRVLCISTPATIHRDLQGTRLKQEMDALDIPERVMLARIGRIDRLDPSLLPSDTSTRKRFRDTWRGVWRMDPDRDVRRSNPHRPLDYGREDYRRARHREEDE